MSYRVLSAALSSCPRLLRKVLLPRTIIQQAPCLTTHSRKDIPPKPLAPKTDGILQHSQKDFAVGRNIHGFVVRRTEQVPELALHAVFLEHEQTGAQYLHVSRADHNNAFGVGFRTPPNDSSGVAHILEHTVLCGSKRYPVRDPFFNMLNRSLSTFMNAMTSSDWTMYPFSTLNQKDYQNLMAVYLDAAFFPNLRNVDFRQEGIRLEPTDPKDANSPIIFKGVVFNEMKGVFSNPENIFGRKIQNYLLPTGTYGHESGGEPMAITQLTWDQLRDFHKSYYHPSNSRFYSYGDMPLDEHLEIVNKTVLSQFKKSPVNSLVKPEPRWTAPREVTVEGPVNPLAPADKQTTVAVSYLLPEVLDPFESFCMGVVGKLLISGPKAPFYPVLLQSGLGSDYAPGTGFDGSIREGIFSVGLKNVAEGDVHKIVDLIRTTIDHVVETGFDPERVDAILHEVELHLKHQTTSFGLHIFFGLMSSWNHDADPIEHLKVNQTVDRFRRVIQDDPKFLNKKVKEYLQDNQHNLVIVMKPNAGYEQAIKAKEDQLLADKLATVDEAAKQKLHRDALELLEEQNKKPDVSVLPTLRVADIEPSLPRVDIQEERHGSTPLLLVRAPTNGVTYFRAVISTERLDPELRPYVPLFCCVATQMGAGDMDYKQLSQKVEMKTGGLFLNDHVSQYHSSTEQFEQAVMLGSYCLDRNLTDMFGLWREIFQRIRLEDMEQFSTLVKQVAADMSSSLADNGHSYAMSYSGSLLRPAVRLKEEWGGLQQIHFLRPIAESTDLAPTLTKMRQIASHLLTSGRMRCSLNATPDTLHGAVDELKGFLSGIQSNPEEQHLVKDATFKSTSSVKTHLTFPFSVHYASRSFPVPEYSNEDYPTCRLLAKILSSKFLHKEIREKGGAYGGGARVSHDGLFNFYSYRDPKSLETFDAFSRSVEWATRGDFTDRDIEEAKLSVFSEVDRPVAPGDQGKRQFVFFVDDDMLQRHRQRLLGVRKEELVHAANAYLQDESKGVSTMLGPPNEEVKTKGWIVTSGSGEEDVRKADGGISAQT